MSQDPEQLIEPENPNVVQFCISILEISEERDKNEGQEETRADGSAK